MPPAWTIVSCLGQSAKKRKKEIILFSPAFAFICFKANLLVWGQINVTFITTSRDWQRERERWHLFKMAVCSGSAFRSGVSVYLLGSLPADSVTKWLPAPSQREAMVRGKFAPLASYWSPNCSAAFSFIVLYWCVLKWLSHAVHADVRAVEITRAQKQTKKTKTSVTVYIRHLQAFVRLQFLSKGLAVA